MIFWIISVDQPDSIFQKWYPTSGNRKAPQPDLSSDCEAKVRQNIESFLKKIPSYIVWCMKVYEVSYLVYEVWYMLVCLVCIKPGKTKFFLALHSGISLLFQKRINQRIFPSDITFSLSGLAGYILFSPLIQTNLFQTVEHYRPLEVLRFPLPAINGFYPSYESSLRSSSEFITCKHLPHDKPMGDAE